MWILWIRWLTLKFGVNVGFMPRIPVIFGPTASGKTALAIALAQELGGEIINADSRQIYARMPIVTACPTVEEYAVVPHHAFEFLKPNERFSAGAWAKLAREKIDEILAQGKVPIVVGGTGFYLRALLEGMSEIPEIPVEIEAGLNGLEMAELRQRLEEVDAVLAAKLMPTDRQRTIRALAVFEHTGIRLSDWQKRDKKAAGMGLEFIKIGINLPREKLHENLAQRWQHTMLERGIEDEMRGLWQAGFRPEMAALRGLGIPLWFEYFAGNMSLDSVLEKSLYRDRQYAKRQYTWLKNSYGADILLENASLEALMPLLRARGLAS